MRKMRDGIPLVGRSAARGRWPSALRTLWRGVQCARPARGRSERLPCRGIAARDGNTRQRDFGIGRASAEARRIVRLRPGYHRNRGFGVERHRVRAPAIGGEIRRGFVAAKSAEPLHRNESGAGRCTRIPARILVRIPCRGTAGGAAGCVARPQATHSRRDQIHDSCAPTCVQARSGASTRVRTRVRSRTRICACTAKSSHACRRSHAFFAGAETARRSALTRPGDADAIHRGLARRWIDGVHVAAGRTRSCFRGPIDTPPTVLRRGGGIAELGRWARERRRERNRRGRRDGRRGPCATQSRF